MFAGHVGAAMALGKVERRLNLGVFVFAALLLDLLLWMFVLLGWEKVSVPADFATRHQLAFEFPFSHGLLASLAWSGFSVVLALAAMKCPKHERRRAALLVGFAVFSHWLLDAAVHTPELPVAGAASAKVGLSLWNHLPVALIVESAIAVVGLWLYLSGITLSRGRRIAAICLAGFVMAMTVLGMTVAPPPPGATQVAVSSLVTIAVVVALFAWFDAGRMRNTGL